MTRIEEIEAKVDLVGAYMRANGLAAVAFGTQANFAWVTAGADSHVGLATEGGVATAVITPTGRHVVTSDIEAPRIATEEVAGLGFEVHVHPWTEDALASVVAQIAGPGEVAADVSLPHTTGAGPALARLRWQLLPPEIERYREVGRATVRVIEETARQAEPGMTELAVAGLLAGRAFTDGLVLNVCLVAADERAYRYRHPIPTEAPIRRHAMLVIGARRYGLAVSVTRLVHFGAPDGDLTRRHEAVCAVDACFMAETRPGARVSDVFQAACLEYARQGFPDEWRHHHQGGATGYAPRDYRGTPTSRETVLDCQAFAWNPSIAGTKSEDTIVASHGGIEVLTPSQDWPTLVAEYQGLGVERPAILVR
jgi:Xaa-Pro aminopeptidase